MPKVASKKTGQNVTEGLHGFQGSEGSEGFLLPQGSDFFEGTHGQQGCGGKTARETVPPPSIKLSLLEYTERALQVVIENAPNREEDWQTGIFEFARILKSHPVLKKVVDPARLLRELPRALGEDWPLALGLNRVEAEIEFIEVWPKIRLSQGVQPIAMAAMLAKETPLALDPKLGDRMEIYHKFISICAWLCVVLNRTNIVIPCEAFSEELCVSRMTISRLRSQAIRDGYMKIAEKHNHFNHKATKFEFKAYIWKPVAEQMALNKTEENTSGE